MVTLVLDEDAVKDLMMWAACTIHASHPSSTSPEIKETLSIVVLLDGGVLTLQKTLLTIPSEDL